MDFGEYQQNLDAFNSAKEQLSNVVDQVKSLHQSKQDAVDKLGTVLQTGGDVGSSVMGVLGTIEQVTKGTQLESAVTSLKSQLSSLKDGITDGIQKGVESGIGKAADAAKALTGNNTQLNTLIDNGANAARSTTSTMIDQAAGGNMGAVLDTAKTAGANLMTTGSDTYKLVRNTGENILKQGEEVAGQAAQEATTQITGMANRGLALATQGASRASSTVTGTASRLTKTISGRVKAVKQQITEQPSETQTAVPEGYLSRNTPLGNALGSEDLATVVRQQVKAGTVDPDTLRVVKETEPDLLKETPSTPQTNPVQPTTTTETVPQPGIDLPDFPGLSELSKMPELPDLPGLSDFFGVVSKPALAASQVTQKLATSEQALSELAGQTTNVLTKAASGISAATRGAMSGTALPSKVLGIVNKGQRGDSTLARALRLGGEKPVKPTELATPVQKTEKIFTPEDLQNVSGFQDPSETILSKYLPKGDFGPVEAHLAATGVPKEVLEQARMEEGTPSSLVSGRAPVQATAFEKPEINIQKPEPTGQAGTTPQNMTGTPNNTSAQTSGPSSQPEGQASSQSQPSQPKSEIEPAEEPAVATPKPSIGAKIAEGGEAALEGGEEEAGSLLGPEGLIGGALLAGITSLIGGLVKEFHKAAPAVPTFANTGVSFGGEQQMTSGSAF